MQNHTIYIPPISNNNNNNTTSLVIITCIGAIYYSMIYILNVDHIVIIQNRYINIIFNLILLVSSIISLIGYIYMKQILLNIIFYCTIRIIFEIMFASIKFILD
jgi:hypothetical protein